MGTSVSRFGGNGAPARRVLGPTVDTGALSCRHQKDHLLERIVDFSLRRITQGRPRRVDDLLQSRTMKGFPQDKGRAATGDHYGDRSAIQYAEGEIRRRWPGG